MNKKKFAPVQARENASEAVGAWWAAMHRFSEEFGYQPEITHLECVEEDWQRDMANGGWRYKDSKPLKIITAISLCACFSSEKDNSLPTIYQEFADWLQPLYENCKLPVFKGLVVYCGFNYENPGLIVASEAGFWYDKQRDLLEIVTTGKLYQDMDDLERGEALEDKAWDAFMTAYEE
jgi:hypothetical protein